MSGAGNDIVALAAIDNQRTHHRPFYSKILSDAEYLLYDRLRAEMPFENFVWLLWSVKESVFKYLKRTQSGLLFSPIKIGIRSIDPPGYDSADPFSGHSADPFCSRSTGLFSCHSADLSYPSSDTGEDADRWETRQTGPGKEFYRGVAVCGSRLFYFRSKIHPAFISTIVHDSANFENIWWGIRSIGHADYAHQSAAVRVFALDKLKELLSGGEDRLQIGKSPLGYPVLLKDATEIPVPLSFAHHAHFVAYSFFLA